MEIQYSKFNHFDKIAYNAPKLAKLNIKDKIDQFFDGIIPELTDKEFDDIRYFLPREDKIKLSNFSSEVIDEIDLNVINITDKEQLRRYLKYLENKIEPIVYVLNITSLNDRIEAIDLDFYANLKIEPTQRKDRVNYVMLHDLLMYDISCYYITYDRVRRHIFYLQYENGFLNEKGSPTHREDALIDKYKTESRHITPKLKEPANINPFLKTMALDKFYEFYALANEVPFILNIMVEDNFKLFLTQTGELPQLSEIELEGIRKYISCNYSGRLETLKSKFIKELQLNNISTSNDNQLKEYLKLLLEKLDPISKCLFKGSFIKEIEENNLYPTPLSLLNNKDNNERIQRLQKLHEEPLQRMGTYTDEEKRLFRLLTEVFYQNYNSYCVILEVEEEIKTVMINRGLILEKDAFGIKNKLSASEIALKHWYLELAKAEKPINGSQVGLKYKHLANKSNIEKAYNAFANKRKTPSIMQLENILSDLSDYPHIQKAIKNDIDKLR